MEDTEGEALSRRSVDETLAPELARSLAPEDADAPEGDDDAPKADGRMATALLRDALEAGASDLHVEPHAAGVRVRMRLDGVLAEAAALDAATGVMLTKQLKTLAGLDPVTPFVPEERRFARLVGERRMDARLVAVPCLGGEKVVMRVLSGRPWPDAVPELGLSDADREDLLRWIERRTGLFVVTGPTGSGKTTTLYSLLRRLAGEGLAACTLEDPVESRVDGAVQIQVDPDNGLGFQTGFRTLLRMDPDVLLVGEIRDPESARVAVRAAVAGRALMSTLHSRSAVGAVTSMRHAGLNDHEISVALSVVVSQRLVPRLCDACREEAGPDRAEAAWLEKAGRVPARVWRAAGCRACRGRGVAGRTGLFEVWVPDAAARAAILEGAPEVALVDLRRAAGGRTLLDDGLDKVEAGIVGVEALRRVPDLPLPG